MQPSEVEKRTYRLPSRMGTQRSSDSLAAEKPFTPAEELSSWLPDEMCVSCGAPVAASQLYCSDECREQEQRNANQEAAEAVASVQLSPKTTAAGYPSSSKSASLQPSSDAHQETASRPAHDESEKPDQERFRYYCPTSPHLLAQRQASGNASDTQRAPGLSTFERSLLTGHCGDYHRPDSNASSNEESGSANERRGSTVSSNTSSSGATDPSTPSPTMVLRASRNTSFKNQEASDSDNGADIEDSEIDDVDFRLPPSVLSCPSAVLMQQGPTHAPSERQVSDPSSAHAFRSRPASFSPLVDRRAGGSSKPPTMSYARRPSSTNLPAPVLYSPALVAKGSAAITTTSSPATMRRRSVWNGVNAAGAGRARRDATHHRGPSVNEGRTDAASAAGQIHSHVKTSSIASVHDASGFVAMKEAPMMRSVSDPAPTSSPQQQRSAGSASSSADHTLRASSPRSVRTAADVCGRPGCSGSSANRGATSPGSHPDPNTVTSRSMTSLANGKARPVGRHKHTHSARAGFDAGLGLTASAATSIKGQSMTPVFARKSQAQEVDGGAESAGPPNHPTELDDEAIEELVEDDCHGASHGRGRSKARGRRSVSRRSRSPPRAAARGRSKALLIEESDRKGRRADSPPLAAVEPSSASPIAITRRESKGERHGGYSSSSAGEDLDRAATMSRQAGSPRRGRSPPERRRRTSTVKAIHGVPLGIVSPTSPLRERGQSFDVGHSEHVDPGFDEVEDLDLEM